MKDQSVRRHVPGTVLLDHDTLAECTFGLNGDGEPVTCSVDRTVQRIRPYTLEMRVRAYRSRGRESFSYGKAVCVLPSEAFYRTRIREEDLFGYRDEED